MWQALQTGWEPPEHVSEEEYAALKNAPPSALRGFVGFATSFAGKWFGGYARGGNPNYARSGRISNLKLAKKTQGTVFLCADYRILRPSGALIYCDPPYEKTTKYAFAIDHLEFWDVIRCWSSQNTVVVSSYAAPPDFDVVWSINTKTQLREASGAVSPRVEKVFRWKGVKL